MKLRDIVSKIENLRKTKPKKANSKKPNTNNNANTTVFWGNRGAGVLFLARDTGRILFPFRSKKVEQPNTWGTFGGAIDPGEDPLEAAVREAEEESQKKISKKHDDIIPLFVFKSPTTTFRYYNYLVVVDSEFKPKLNWETEDYKWVRFNEWPSPLHFGVEELLKDQESIRKIKAAIGND